MKIAGIVVAILAVVGISSFIIIGNSSRDLASQTSDSSMPSEEKGNERVMGSSESLDEESDAMMDGDVKTAKTYTLADVSEHSVANDCWLAIEGKVYDVTDFIKSGLHPGGDQILKGCGKDATFLFNNRPNGSGEHSDRARGNLPNFYIGDLEK